MTAHSGDLKCNQVEQDELGSAPVLPVKPLRFQIKQLEKLVAGDISPHHQSINKTEIETKIQQLKLMLQMENISCSKDDFHDNNIYAVPKFFYPQVVE